MSSFLVIFSLTKLSISIKLTFDVTDVSAMTTLLGICYIGFAEGVCWADIFTWSVESGRPSMNIKVT